VELNGALSNPQAQLEEVLQRLGELKKRLSRRPDPVAPRPPIAPRPGRIVQAVNHVLAMTGRPTRVKDVHQACEEYLGEPISYAAVKNCLFERARGAGATVVRVGWGTYVHQ
jgi:hypothetical protein